jgi:hypothetical protein
MKHYMNIVAMCPVLIIIRAPWPMPRWRMIKRAATTVMHKHGCRQKDIYAIEGLVAYPAERNTEDCVMVQRLEAGYSGDPNKVPNFWLYDWSNSAGGSFKLSRPGRV